MHELSIAQNILDLVNEQLPARDRTRLRSINLRIGELAGVVPESLEFCIAAITSGTEYEGIRLALDRVPFVVECKACGRRSTNDEGVFICSSCFRTDLKLISGDELELISVELSDAEGVAA